MMIQNDVLSSAREEGLTEGESKGKRLVAINMKQQGISLEIISQCTGLPINEIQML